LHEQEREIWSNAGKLLGDLAGIWNAYVERAEESRRFVGANRLENSDSLAVTPGPGSFREFVDLLMAAATNEEVRAADYEAPLIDAGPFRTEHGGAVYDVRSAGSEIVSVRRRLDARDVLFNVVPDLRAAVRKLQ
jgi:hypothetical protein